MNDQSPPKRRPKRNSQAMDELLIESIAEAKSTPIELARELGLSLRELATWSAEPEHAKVIEALARLSDLRAQMLLSQYRANAAVQLIGIASSSEPNELSRKACVDLLNANMTNVFRLPDEARSAPPSPFGPPSVDADKIRDALESLGRDSP